ncbi:MAG: sigma 54-interacting transcriptional regulator [Deltaproteobacteria bacterium]|nr:sigma 54-interacting transcriptional regulator [Deltaproteobacteria bacterium]
MKKFEDARLLPHVDIGSISFKHVSDDFYDGIIISDTEGKIVYMNNTQAKIDALDRFYALGKRVTELYRVDEGQSPMMTCIRTQKPIENLACYYRTHLGKVVNSIHNVFPLFLENQFVGVICYIRDYSIIEQMYDSVAKGQLYKIDNIATLPQPKKKLANGTRFRFEDIIGNNSEFLRAKEIARLSSQSPSPVMLFGETGTGKELFAQSIHNHGPRKNKQFVAVNCTAIPENLLEGTLFGTSRGAFTGSIDKPGLFELANGGTLLLDEVNSMAIGLQAKLLRALQERKVRRVGSLEEKEIDLKIISSVNTDPHWAIESGSMRSDLLYRLAVVFIRIPPLRERKDDLTLLINHFLTKCNQALGKNIHEVSEKVLDIFRLYQWPGNTRELEHVIEGAINLVNDHEAMDIQHLSTHITKWSYKAGQIDELPLKAGLEGESYRSTNFDPTNISSISRNKLENTRPEKSQSEIKAIQRALEAAHGSATKASKILGISPQLLNYRMKKYRIDRKIFAD